MKKRFKIKAIKSDTIDVSDIITLCRHFKIPCTEKDLIVRRLLRRRTKGIKTRIFTRDKKTGEWVAYKRGPSKYQLKQMRKNEEP